MYSEKVEESTGREEELRQKNTTAPSIGGCGAVERLSGLTA